MKKIILFFLAGLYLSSCNEQIESSSLLEISANVATKSVSAFLENDSIGLFVQKIDGSIYNNCDCSLNAKAVYSTGKWNILQNIRIGADTGSVFAYYPYNAGVTDYKNIPVTTAAQVDYLYSDKASVIATQPRANLTMKHAMSLVSFQISRNNYPGTGVISHIEITGIPTTGMLDVSTGDISAGTIKTFSHDCNMALQPAPISIDFIALPCNTDGVTAVFTVDGKTYTYKFPTGALEKGKTNTYSLSLNYTELLQTGSSVSPWVAGNSYTGDLNLITK